MHFIQETFPILFELGKELLYVFLILGVVVVVLAPFAWIGNLIENATKQAEKQRKVLSEQEKKKKANTQGLVLLCMVLFGGIVEFTLLAIHGF